MLSRLFTNNNFYNCTYNHYNCESYWSMPYWLRYHLPRLEFFLIFEYFFAFFLLKTLIRQDWFRKISMFNGLPLFLFSDNHNDHDDNNTLRSHCCLRRVLQRQLWRIWKSLSTKSLSFNMLHRLLYNDDKSLDNNYNVSNDNHNSSVWNVSHELRNSLCSI